jgi:hypothetical protein
MYGATNFDWTESDLRAMFLLKIFGTIVVNEAQILPTYALGVTL